jgi:hypothetical protein
MGGYRKTDRCPCGSGFIFKKCHGAPVSRRPTNLPPLPDPRNSLYARNVAFLDGLENIFRLSTTPWDDIRKTLSNDHVQDVYGLIPLYWPRDTDLPSLLPEPNPDRLRALFMGSPEPESLIHSVFRFSLYSDELLLFDPFFANMFRPGQHLPLKDPQPFRADLLKLLYSMKMLDPWIRGGIVKLIPEPGYFDRKLDAWTVETAARRMQGVTFSEEEQEEMASDARNDVHRLMKRMPRELQLRWAREYDPSMSDEAANDLLDYMAQDVKHDHLALDQPLEERASQFHVIRQGANLESALYVCELTGAFPYASERGIWRQIEGAAERTDVLKNWSGLARGFGDLRFRFLNDVDTHFAYRIREEERLHGFRQFLRTVWTAVRKEQDHTTAANLSREFEAELRDQYGKANAEWRDIDKDLLRSAAPTAGGGIASIIAGLLPAFATLTTVGLAGLIWSRGKRDTFRRKTPMAVMLDLAKFAPKI